MTREETFTALFHEHYDAVERFVLRRAPDLDVADITAEAFLVAWRRSDQVPRGTPLPWLYGVARYVLANRIRAAQQARRLADSMAQQPMPVGVDHADEVSQRVTIAIAFDSLNDVDREVLRLVAWEGLGSRDAAAVMGCGITTFAMRLNRARRRLGCAIESQPHRPAPTRTVLEA
jgi:RNA polymerase sigma-70 factor (ECF subfamily)